MIRGIYDTDEGILCWAWPDTFGDGDVVWWLQGVSDWFPLCCMRRKPPDYNRSDEVLTKFLAPEEMFRND